MLKKVVRWAAVVFAGLVILGIIIGPPPPDKPNKPVAVKEEPTPVTVAEPAPEAARSESILHSILSEDEKKPEPTPVAKKDNIGFPCTVDLSCMARYRNYKFVSRPFTGEFLQQYQKAFRKLLEDGYQSQRMLTDLTPAMRSKLIKDIDRMSEAVMNTRAQSLGDKWFRDNNLQPQSLWEPLVAFEFILDYTTALFENLFRDGLTSEDPGIFIVAEARIKSVHIMNDLGIGSYKTRIQRRAELFSSERTRALAAQFWAGRPKDFWLLDGT